jgi:hypothetical protein
MWGRASVQGAWWKIGEGEMWEGGRHVSYDEKRRRVAEEGDGSM